MQEQELLYLLMLHKMQGIGHINAKKLLQYFGSATALFQASANDLKEVDGIGSKRIKTLRDSAIMKGAEQELNFIQSNTIKLSYFKDEDYPSRLKQCIDSPILLFSRGNINLKNKPILSIVGTRQVTTHGIAFCEQLIEDLAPLKPVIVSGLAYGIDIVAHRAAIKYNLQTIACLAHGLNQIYPKVHQKYVSSIENNGGFFTDFCSDDTFDRKNFLSRNRIIAGLSEATIVIESAEKGGSLVTADIAHSYDREVFAVPGRPQDRFSKGCNMLIKQQKAQMITSAADLVYNLNWDIETKKKNTQTQLFVYLNDDEKFVLQKLTETGKAEIDALSLICGLPTHKLSSILLNLELGGFVRPLPGKQFEII
ncbi:DNA protecting protein involved in transformation DprA/Smf [Psychroflexus torquis ATCC 700755]|uniref:DNA protecting protein involved in transformation DprA/Smf n=1 Tax=Psychroflexus torquis (strain ATCC 700755 / CIP 106069 / ACAM 623) TaxID=313595 RepID=K4IBW1_PSYTT|nr:DNA-processing protein DprA [Psychroflexus torquis]AFU68087.1 DNA protecting protein involved in transformation DprA/Smf [Psychroflexus torquis ATCC 700755]